MTVNRKRHATVAAGGRWELLGELLQARRQQLGYRFRPAFARDRLPATPDGNRNVRLPADIENHYRDTYPPGTLRLIAHAYEVTYESLTAVLAGNADRLAAVPAVPPGWAPPMDPVRAASDRPWFDPVNERRVALAARGITDPAGAQMFPDSPDDAKAWDGIGARLPVGDRVWFIADLRRRAAARAAGSGTAQLHDG